MKIKKKIQQLSALSANCGVYEETNQDGSTSKYKFTKNRT